MKLIWVEQVGDKKCMYCHSCIAVCLKRALHFKKNMLVWDEKKCNGCGRCAETCPEEVIKLVK